MTGGVVFQWIIFFIIKSLDKRSLPSAKLFSSSGRSPPGGVCGHGQGAVIVYCSTAARVYIQYSIASGLQYCWLAGVIRASQLTIQALTIYPLPVESPDYLPSVVTVALPPSPPSHYSPSTYIIYITKKSFLALAILVQ